MALSLTAKGQDGADLFGPMDLMIDIKTSQETLKNLDRLLKLSAQLMVVTQGKFDLVDQDSHATAAQKADAKADYVAAANNYKNLLTWQENINNRIAYDQTQLGGMGIRDAAKDNGFWEAARDAAKDAASAAREAASAAARENAHAATDSMRNCPDGH
jgi:hypothetical protein